MSVTSDRRAQTTSRTVVERLSGDGHYVAAFRRAFGRNVDVHGFRAALVAFQKSLLVADSRFDRYRSGRDTNALTESEKHGFAIFRKAGCGGCHVPTPHNADSITLFTDGRFHNLGVGYANGRMSDVGRYLVTRQPADWGAFRTPSLRNVAATAPYMHDGSIATLEEVVAFYDRGGNKNPQLDEIVSPLHLTEQDKADLVGFLRTLTSHTLTVPTATVRTSSRASRGEPQ